MSWEKLLSDPDWPVAGFPGARPEGFDLYDVLDHSHDPVSILNKLEGRVKIRFHPWSARHGGHAKINKAFAHLVIPPVDLMKFGVIPFNKKVIDISIYEKWIRDAGFVVADRVVIREKIEPWIVDNLFPIMKIGHKLSNGLHSAWPIVQISYVDIIAYRKSRY